MIVHVLYAYKTNFTDLPFSWIIQSSVPSALYFFSVLLFTVNRARSLLSKTWPAVSGRSTSDEKMFVLNTRTQLDCYFVCVCVYWCLCVGFCLIQIKID